MMVYDIKYDEIGEIERDLPTSRLRKAPVVATPVAPMAEAVPIVEKVSLDGGPERGRMEAKSFFSQIW